MTINGISGVEAGSQMMYGAGQATDSYSKSIQNQIANAQKQLQELSSNEELSLEDKMKKRQEIQQEITSLNQQLKQRQVEMRKEAQKKSSNSMDDLLGGNRQAQKKSGKTGTGMSGASMQAIISADASMDQVQVQSSVKGSLEGRAAVLKAEIKQDGGKGCEAKEAELADTEEKINDVASAQMSAISDINKNLEEAAKEDTKTEKKETAADKAEENKDADKKENDKTESVEADSAAAAAEESTSKETDRLLAGYTPVDVRL